MVILIIKNRISEKNYILLINGAVKEYKHYGGERTLLYKVT